ncbi:MAG: EamA family transporter [Bacilli bacterium]|nr:EamA family transporter [Bacilli bacterium]
MKNIWIIYVISYLILYVIYTQYYKITTRTCKNTSALTVLLRFTSGIIILITLPLFKFKIPTNTTTYIFLGIACIFFALSDRMYTRTLKELEVSTYSVLAQLSTIFIFILGIIFFKEPIIIKRIIGALLILIANIMILYKKRKFEWNKYYLYNIIANLSFAIGTTLNIGISNQFNLPFYIAITLCTSAILIFIFERIQLKDIIKEYKEGNKKAIIIVSILDGVTSLIMLRAYQLQNVTILAPLFSLKTILNVFIAHLVLKEKTPLLKKIIAAIIIIIGVALINI